ncbi:hypothetical protein BB561_006004, partial [Smittium simulii]
DNKIIAPKARAIGATIAERTGISTDAILTQANWLSYYMLSSYYKPSKNSYSNITESRISSKYIVIYQELTNAVTSITNDFFKFNIIIMKRTRLMGTCPRNKGMVYGLPAFNNIGSLAKSKKSDAHYTESSQAVGSYSAN